MTNSTPNQQRILIVEDEDNARKGYEALLRKWNWEILGVGSGEEALAKFQEFQPSLILADVELPGMNGLDLLKQLGDDILRIPVIIITGRGSDERVVQAIEAGAYWYIEKPLKPPVLRALLERALGHVRNQQAVVALTRELRTAGKLGTLVGTSAPMQDVMRQVEIAAPSTASVLITGETGSGKEMVARSIHMLSPRADRPFVAINCSAIPESLMESEIFGHEKGSFTGAMERRTGCFELAEGGTLLLDEIGEMPIGTQAKLLRVLEDRKLRRLGSKVETSVDVRVLAATNKVPDEAVARGELRSDLYYRLNVFNIHMPPLREHKEDIPDLVQLLLTEMSTKHARKVAAVSEAVLNQFNSYSWPGNVRELRNTLERAVIVCDAGVVETKHLPPGFGQAPLRTAANDPDAVRLGVGTTVEEAEKMLILKTLEATSNNKTRAAEILGISLKTLHNKLKEYGSAAAEAVPGKEEVPSS
jgi:DNA-binding NtrC family response regulator